MYTVGVYLKTKFNPHIVLLMTKRRLKNKINFCSGKALDIAKIYVLTVLTILESIHNNPCKSGIQVGLYRCKIGVNKFMTGLINLETTRNYGQKNSCL